MMRPALSAVALSVLAAAALAACSANFKPNTVTFPGSETPAANTQTASAGTASMPAAASTAAPAAVTAMSVASAPEPAPAATSASSAATVVSAPAAAPVNMPTRGMLMSTVAHEFGEPEQKLPAVPDPGTKLHPPITRWVYPQYVVYFEYNYVVHSVLKAQPFSNQGTGSN